MRQNKFDRHEFIRCVPLAQSDGSQTQNKIIATDFGSCVDNVELIKN